MGYLHIDNLYKNTEILLFRRCYALEKIHGTSAHINWKDNKMNLSPGGESYEKFKSIFDIPFLESKFKELFEDIEVIIFGEAYGGKCQGMSNTYGKELKFIVFDVMIHKIWLDVLNAENVAKKLGLEFVDYKEISTNLKKINFEKDKPSTQAIRNGCGNDKLREGIVLRPLIEVTKNNGDRIIAKHKREEFLETKTKREVNPEQLKILEDAKAIAEEWVTPNRIKNIFSHLKEEEKRIENMGNLIKKVVEDIERESKGEVIFNNQVKKIISTKSVKLIKSQLSTNKLVGFLFT